MKIRIWGLVAFNVAAMYVIFQAASPKLTTTLLIILFSTNILLGMVFRRFPPRASSTGDAISWLPRASWDCYIPVLGGMVGILVGVFELSWRLCLVGIVAIAIGFLRIWARRHVQQVVRAHPSQTQ